ncbi:MAG: urease accessory protein UreF [Magnetovibrionaceae bacterium]
MTEAVSDQALLRLLAWTSPAFPIGAFSYSHGLEYAIEEGLVRDAETLTIWIEGLLAFGSASQDAALFVEAFGQTRAKDWARLEELSLWANALRPTSELALEAQQQGGSFLDAVASAWGGVEHLPLAKPVSLVVAFGAVTALFEVSSKAALQGYLHSFVANLISAAVRAIPLGQTDGIRALAALEPAIVGLTQTALGRALGDPLPGTAALVNDWCSAAHETQYSRLFRS